MWLKHENQHERAQKTRNILVTQHFGISVDNSVQKAKKVVEPEWRTGPLRSPHNLYLFVGFVTLAQPTFNFPTSMPERSFGESLLCRAPFIKLPFHRCAVNKYFIAGLF